MNRSTVLHVSAVFVLMAGVSAIAHAQLPQNNDTWKARCNLLASSAGAIESGNPPAALVAATRGVASHPFYVLAVDRAQADQHYVACTLYYMAAIAARQGNGGAKDVDAANDYAILAGAELKDARGESLSMSEHMKRLKLKASVLTGQSLSSTPSETSAVIAASTTMPLSLNQALYTSKR